MNKKGPLSSNCALWRAKEWNNQRYLSTSTRFVDQVMFFFITDNVNEKTLNYENKRGNPISSKEKCLKTANIHSTFHLEYSWNEI